MSIKDGEKLDLNFVENVLSEMRQTRKLTYEQAVNIYKILKGDKI